jgi:hypothetical protein
MFALIYFPEGISTDTAALNKSTETIPTSLYSPEQHVLTSGIVRDNSLTVARSSRGRSLSNGDSVWLLARLFSAEGATSITAKVTFSIAFG